MSESVFEPDNLAVIAVPELSRNDRSWIEDVRRSHDPLHAIVPAHFTLMFPAPFGRAGLLEHVALIATQVPEIIVRLSHATVHEDALSEDSYVFIEPTLGGDAITRLHDALYMGEYERFRRPGIPYEPHVTVGRHADPAAFAALAAELNTRGIDIEGRIDAVDIVLVTSSAVTTLERIPLGRGDDH